MQRLLLYQNINASSSIVMIWYPGIVEIISVKELTVKSLNMQN